MFFKNHNALEKMVTDMQDKLIRAGKECLRLEEVTFKSQQDNRVYREKYELSERAADDIRERYNRLVKTHHDVCGKIETICHDNDRLANLLKLYGIDPNMEPVPETIGMSMLLRHHEVGEPLTLEEGRNYKLLIVNQTYTGKASGQYWEDCHAVSDEGNGLILQTWDESEETYGESDDFWLGEEPEADDMKVPTGCPEPEENPCESCDADSDDCDQCPVNCGEDEPW